MVNYQNGKIYRLDCLTTGKVYIGSTTKETLAMRLTEHVSQFKKWIEGKTVITSFQIIENGNYKISLIELYPCDSKDELTARESYYIRTMECVNKVIPDRTKEEYNSQYYEKNKDKLLKQMKQYEETHKEKLEEYRKLYNETHKDKITEYQKKYRETHKEQRVEYDKQYNEAHQEQIKKRKKEHYTCVCGSIVQHSSKSSHERTKRHLEYIS